MFTVAVSLDGVRTVLLAGTGSDDDYLLRAFGPALRRAGAIPIGVAPQQGGVVRGYLQALREAAGVGPIAVGGVSLGAAVAARWALEHPATIAVLAALPAWSGAAGDAPAALSARHTAGQLRRDGLQATTALMRATSPAWLADELDRSWRRQWPWLPDAMEEAAGYLAPTADELSGLAAPIGVAAAVDDPIHPLEVGRQWATAAPRGALRTISLAEFGPRPELLGAACLSALASLD